METTLDSDINSMDMSKEMPQQIGNTSYSENFNYSKP